MIINYFEFKSINFNSHHWVKSDVIDGFKYNYICSICNYIFVRILGDWQNSEFEDEIFISEIYDGKTINQLFWDEIDNKILSCNESIIKNIIE